MSVTIRLPFPPSSNLYWRTIYRGKYPHTYLSKEGKRFRELVLAAVIEHRGGVPKPMVSRLAVFIEAVVPDRRKRDIDNLFKATLDALTYARVWEDDSQIDDLRIVRGGTKKPGWLDVTIEKIEQPQRELFGS